MGKREDFISKLKPIINDPEKLESFLLANSNLPGPRGNLELAFGLAEIYDDWEVLLKWTLLRLLSCCIKSLTGKMPSVIP
jgi:hypothetical protein